MQQSGNREDDPLDERLSSSAMDMCQTRGTFQDSTYISFEQLQVIAQSKDLRGTSIHSFHVRGRNEKFYLFIYFKT